MSFRLPDLTPDQRREIADAEKQLTAIEREIKRVKGPGIDTSEAEATAARYREIIAHLKRTFGPRRAGVE